MKKSYYAQSILIFLISFALFSYGLFDRELIGFETRFGLFAKEMLQHGLSFFPTTYGVPYPDYPALSTILIYLASLPCSHLTTFSAILPSVLACSLTLVTIHRLLLPYDRTWAIAAVLWCLLTFQFLLSARTLSLDALLMAVSIWAFSIARSDSPWYWYSKKMLGLLFIFTIGFAIRGPIGLVLPAGIVCVTLWSQQPFKSTWPILSVITLHLVLLLLLLSLAAYHTGGISFVKQVAQMQIFGRMSDPLSQHQRWDYFTEAFGNYALSFEMALVTLCLWGKKIYRAATPSYQLLRQCAFVIAVVMIGMSIPGMHKIRYILPMTPALAMVAGFAWSNVAEHRYQKPLLSIVHYFCLALPVVSMVLVSAFIITTHLTGRVVNAHYFSAYFLLAVLALCSLYMVLHDAKTFAFKYPLIMLSLAVASFWVVLVFVMQPIEVSLNRSKPLVTAVLSHLPPATPIAFFKIAADSEAIQFRLNAPLSIPLQFVEQVPLNAKAYFITRQSIWNQQSDAFKQQMQILQQGNLGHQAVVVFKVRDVAE